MSILPLVVGFVISAPTSDDLFTQASAIIARRCLSCHNAGEKKGDLDLQTQEGFKKGGEGGPVIDENSPRASRFLEVISANEGAPEMPKDADPLSADEVRILTKWIEQKAPWPNGAKIEPPRVEVADWWSLRPLRMSDLPTEASDRWCRGPIDFWIRKGHRSQRLQHSAEASSRTLGRRLWFDLIGLPPEPQELDNFVADARADAYERLVDRLLASPRYGERWARHWLDVVHFGETHGYDKDKPRPNAWPYRDYVIRSFNQDKAYSQFVSEQLAGDVLFPDTVDGIAALGFLSAGPWDFIGHAEVPETKIDGKIARHLDRDDMVSTTINTFCSLTVQCAQCHHHKFDPMTQEDYYRLQAVFAALDRADKPFDQDPLVARQRRDWTQRRQDALDAQSACVKRIQEQGGAELAEIEKHLAEADKRRIIAPPEHGYHSAIESSADREKWVSVDLGQTTSIDRIVLIGCHDEFNGIGAGFGFPKRFKIEIALEADFSKGAEIVLDQTAADQKNPGVEPLEVNVGGRAARFVRFTATQLAPRQNDFILALAELIVFDQAGKNVAQGRPVTARDSIEAPVRWLARNLVDGIFPRWDVPAEKLAEWRSQRDRILEERVDQTLIDENRRLTSEITRCDAELSALPQPSLVYAATVHRGEGAFRGTGHDGGRPRAIHVLARGDVTRPGEQVFPGAIEAIQPMTFSFNHSEKKPEGDARSALSQWIIDHRNPLTWRSIVNRVWLYHFGRGIVDTPSDFGRMGQKPDHPELLEMLAIDFRDTGGAFKSLTRQIVESATYRQASQHHEGNAAIDADNRFLWRGHRRRLEAEAVRDAILSVSGSLSSTMGGPSFQDFIIERPEHSPHYEYHLHDPGDMSCWRRSVYRFTVRSKQNPFMTTLDCADASMLVEKRNETISAPQALAMLNNDLVLSMARNFARRVESDRPDPRSRIAWAFELVCGRAPTDSELADLMSYESQYGLENTCRVILNLNELVFVD